MRVELPGLPTISREQYERELKADIDSFAHDPEGFADYAYPWGKKGSELEHEALRTWQRKILRKLGEMLRASPQNANTLIAECLARIAVASGHGIGKSALISIIINWGMATCVDCKGVVTANTLGQLMTKTWPEVRKWHRLSITRDWFVCHAMSMVSTDPEHQNWRIDVSPWSEHNTEAFQGLHNRGKRLIIIFDEASAIADKVWEVTDGALTDEGTEIIWVAFGNPTRASGRFREAFRRFRQSWVRYNIDNRTVEGTNKKLLAEMVEAYGEDSDIVKVRIRGEFPSQSMMQFIGEDLARGAAKKKLRESEYNFAPKILTCDPAWTGDDELVIAVRQGNWAKILKRIPRNDNDVAIAQMLAQYEDDLEADSVVIDLGFGTGIFSYGQSWGRDWQLFNFGVNLPKSSGVLNERARIWLDMKRWLEKGGVIEDIEELIQDLTGVEVVPRPDGVLQLESKKDMKDRGLPSPNLADAIALTFAYPVRPRVGSNTDKDLQGVTRARTDRREC